MNAKTVLAVAAVAVAISFAIYSPSLHGPFVFDGANIENGSRLHITSLGELERIVFADGVPRRIGLASFALSFYVHQLRPFGYHVVNVSIHAINGLFLFWFSYRILSLVGASADVARRSALLAAILWLVHPVQTQAVAYIYQRFTSLAATFFLLSLCTYLEAGRSARTARILLYVASFSTALLAFGTKEIAGTLPLVIVIIEIVLRGRTARPTLTLLLPLLAFGVVCAVYLGPNFVDMMVSQYQQRGFTLTERLLTEARVVVHYLSLMIWPHPSRLTLDYDVSISTSLFAPPATAACIGVMAMLSGSALLWVRRYPLYSFAILWFFGNLAVESTFVPLEIAYEHRVCLPSMALFTWLAHGIMGLTRSKLRAFRTRCGWSFGVAVEFLDLREEPGVGRPGRSLGGQRVKGPGKARVHAKLGKAYRRRGQHGAAERSFRRALEIEPSMTGAYVSLANVRGRSARTGPVARSDAHRQHESEQKLSGHIQGGHRLGPCSAAIMSPSPGKFTGSPASRSGRNDSGSVRHSSPVRTRERSRVGCGDSTAAGGAEASRARCGRTICSDPTLFLRRDGERPRGGPSRHCTRRAQSAGDVSTERVGRVSPASSSCT